MPQSPALFRGQLYLDSQVHPRFSEAGTGWGGRQVHFLKKKKKKKVSQLSLVVP